MPVKAQKSDCCQSARLRSYGPDAEKALRTLVHIVLFVVFVDLKVIRKLLSHCLLECRSLNSEWSVLLRRTQIAGAKI